MTVHRLIEEHAKSSPESVAMSYEGREYTYGELEREARHHANALRARGVAPGDLVGLGVNRSPEAVIGLLAILKTGAGYVPLDPKHPRQHLQRMIDMTGLRVVVNASTVATSWRFESIEQIAICCGLESEREDDGASVDVSPEDVAAVVFTSGSEAEPKGVVVPHRAIVARWRQIRDSGSRAELSCVLPSISSIGHVSSLLLPLMAGRRVVIAPDEAVLNLRLLARLTRQCGVTGIPLVPTQFRALLDDDVALGLFDHLRVVVLRAEPVQPELVRIARARLPGIVLLNGYGATETTGLVSYARITDPDRIVISHEGLLPHMHILDGDVAVKAGDVGELCVTGPQLASGYLKDLGLTNSRFVSSPFPDDEQVMYRTGDFARCGPDGAVEIVGRMDQQIKIRGYRVNLGDVEARLQRIPGVARAIVLLHQGRIHAYLLAQRTGPEIRAALSEQVPTYTVPEVIVLLPELPVLPDGKVDRRALTRVPRELERHVESVAGTAVQKSVGLLWSEVLNISAIGPNDDLFELGGTSLEAAMILSKVEDFFGVELSMDEFLGDPTIEGCARQLDLRRGSERDVE